MPLFGPVHSALLIATLIITIALVFLIRRKPTLSPAVRRTLGFAIAINELIWWWFRYSHEGFRFPDNLPLQLCDATVWAAVAACLTLNQTAVEFAYFAGIAGAGMALITPDLWSPWPSYPAIYFFLAHGGIVIAAIVLVFGGLCHLRRYAVWRSFGLLVLYATLVGIFDKIFHTDYMYLCAKPKNASLLDMFGPWPLYLAVTAAVALVLFFLIWIPTRASAVTS